MTDLRDRVARALWKVDEDEHTFDDAKRVVGTSEDKNELSKASLRWIYEMADAAIAEMGAGVRVKPLDWVKSNTNPWDGDYHTIPTGYTVRGLGGGFYKLSFHGGFGMHTSPDAAKDAAQFDWERRVKSALEPAPISVAEAARALLADRWGGYGNTKAMTAMWEFVHKEHGRHMLPQSHYDGVFQAALRALVGKEGE